MASVIKNSEEKKMADEEMPEDAEAPRREKPPKGGKSQPIDYSRNPAPAGPGFFTIYKKGQGYWTRVGTVIGVVMLGAFTAYNLYHYLPTFFPDVTFTDSATAEGLTQPQRDAILANHAAIIAAHQSMISHVTIGVVLAFTIGYAFLAWRLLNRPRNVDFLIATDSEMKKVNWTSRRELIGSTQIVIIFMFLVAAFLFAVDWIFGILMWAIKVLSVPPWGGS